jgi:hypothetical protein
MSPICHEGRLRHWGRCLRIAPERGFSLEPTPGFEPGTPSLRVTSPTGLFYLQNDTFDIPAVRWRRWGAVFSHGACSNRAL